MFVADEEPGNLRQIMSSTYAAKAHRTAAEGGCAAPGSKMTPFILAGQELGRIMVSDNSGADSSLADV